MSTFRRFFGLLPPMTSGEPPKPIGDTRFVPIPPKSNAPVEPKTLLEIGKWFHDEKCWMYKGTLPVLLQFHPKTAEHCTEPYVVSGCSSCEGARLRSQHGRVKKWLILPP